MRRIEVHALVDDGGVAWAVGVCEGTAMMESSAAHGRLERRLRARGPTVGRRRGGSGACSVVFLVEADDAWSIVGVRPGLGAGHAITEMTTGIDLVKLQLHVADGGRLDGRHRTERHCDHAVLGAPKTPNDTCRWRREGRSSCCACPAVPASGSTEGSPRATAITGRRRLCDRDADRMGTHPERGRRCGSAGPWIETVVVVEGGATNRGDLLDPPAVSRRHVAAFRPNRPTSVLAHVGGGHRRLRQRTRWAPTPTSSLAAGRGRPQAGSDITRRVELRHRGRRNVLDVSRIGPIRYRVRPGDAHADVDLRRLAGSRVG